MGLRNPVGAAEGCDLLIQAASLDINFR